MRSIGRLFANNQQTDIYSHNVKYIKLLQFFNSLYFLVPVWVSFELKFISLSQLALVEVMISASQLFLELPTGALADLFGRKATIAIGYFIGFASYFAFSFCTNFQQFMIVAFFFGLFESLISGSKDALLFDTLKEANKEEKYAELSNQFQIIFNWGIAFATLIGGLVYKFNFRLPTLLNSFAFLASALISLKLIEPAIDSEQFTLKNYIRQTKEGFKELFKDKKSREASWFYILVGSITWPVIIGLKNISFISFGYTEAMLGFVLPVINLTSVYFLHFLLKKEKFESLKFTYLLLSILPTIALILGGFMNKYFVLPIVLVLTFVSGARWNVLGKLTNYCYSSKNRATAISSLNMSISIVYVIVMGLFSYLSQGNDNSIRIIYSLLALTALVFLLPTGIKLAKKYDNKKVELNEEAGAELEFAQADAITEN